MKTLQRLAALVMALGGTALLGAQQVKVEGGLLRGTADAQSGVTAYLGIPYAAPPVGDFRWREPQKAAPWSGVRAADHFAASCMQVEHDGTFGGRMPWTPEFMTQGPVSEDCLYLNVWTPKAETATKLPVIVFFHGGGFSEGSGSIAVYNGAHLAAKGAVVVTVNYRLGVFGFLAHPELTAESPHHASGNYGLMDQLAALAWLRRNVGAFGGDTQKIAVWGQSAGAFSVGALVASPLSKGLFHAAMADSGLSLAALPTPDLKIAEQIGVNFAASLNARSLKELRALPASALLPPPARELGRGGIRFGVIVDGYVLPDTPNNIVRRGADQAVALITGFQANDGVSAALRPTTQKDYEAKAHQAYGPLADEFLNAYPVTRDDEVVAAMVDSTRDRDRVAMYLWACERARNHTQPTYAYFFTRALPWPEHPEFGAFHTGELPYFFENLKVLNHPYQGADFKLADEVSDYLINFARSGNPNGAGLPVWNKVALDAPQVQELGVKTGPIPAANEKRLRFWIKYFNSDVSKSAPVF